MEKIQKNNELPDDHRLYTDKYFLRANHILIHVGLNPRVSMKVFARGEGKITGLEDAVDVLLKYSDLKDKNGEIWVSKDEFYKNKDPLIIIKGPIQSFIELETMYLGVLSSAISRADGIPDPEPEYIKDKLKKLKNIYEDIPISYFGARHYHWSLDKEIAKSALEGGAIQTSTDIGSSNIGKCGVGTMPHALILTLAYYYGRDKATLKAARLFNEYFGDDVPVTTLIDTFNRELTDSLMVARHFHDTKKTYMRIDTCGENIGENCSAYNGEKEKDPSFKTGT